MIPLKTEVLAHHASLVTGISHDEDGRTVVEMDVRQAEWWRLLNLPRGAQIHWADVRTVDIQELSVAQNPICYRLTYGDGWYSDKDGRRRYFPIQPHLRGIDLYRQCTEVAMRAAVLMVVTAGVGLRSVCWLMGLLFHFGVSKSALERWVKACASQLPDAAGMAKLLHAEKPIREAHFDELYPKGQRPKRCTLMLRDEHGRIFAVKEVEERDEEAVAKFLAEVKSWGIQPEAFYVDGYKAYRNAIQRVFPEAVIQYDYFHVIQSIWRELWSVVVQRRKAIKAQGEATQRSTTAKNQDVGQGGPGTAQGEAPQPPVTSEDEGAARGAPGPVQGQTAEQPTTPQDPATLAKRIWNGRYLFLKRDENMSDEERDELEVLIKSDSTLATVRGFALAVWDIFSSPTESAAFQALQSLFRRPEVQPRSAFKKSALFLRNRFEDMVAFLRHPGIKRYSLAEPTNRCLRRLECGHDGFRGAKGFDRCLRLYQAVKYCDWTVYRSSPGLGLPSRCGPTPGLTPLCLATG